MGQWSESGKLRLHFGKGGIGLGRPMKRLRLRLLHSLQEVMERREKGGCQKDEAVDEVDQAAEPP